METKTDPKHTITIEGSIFNVTKHEISNEQLAAIQNILLIGTSNNLIVNTHSNFRNKSHVSSKRKKGGTLKKTIVRDEILSKEFEPTLEGFPGYHDLKTKSEKLLWILIKAKNEGFDDLNHKEVESISDGLGALLKQKSMTALSQPYVVKGFVITPNRDGIRLLKIQQKGIEYMKSKLGEVAEK